ncbi:MAG: nucleotidyltransferase family protein [Deltaproteobacteria bacterium]|nr:nucleotidyltransferase family protein [Deltaproteobacteria bacterium]
MNNIMLVPHVSKKLSCLSQEEQISIRKDLSMLQENPLAGVKLQGPYVGLSLFRISHGLQIIYRAIDSDICVVAVTKGEHYKLSSRERISAVILAAGKSKDHSITRIVDATEAFSKTLVDEVILVLGYRADAVKERVTGEKIRVVVNQDYEGVLSRSLRCGLRAVTSDASAVFLALGNQDLIDAALIDNLLKVYRQEKASIVAPSKEGRLVHPLIFDRILLPELFKVRGNIGGRNVVRRYEREIRKVTVA